MKILLINEECGTGSTGRICTDIASALEQKGHEAKIVFGRNAAIVPDQYRKYAVRIGNDIDLRVHGMITRGFDATGFGSKKSTKIMIEWIRSYQPDVIHLHNLHGYYINIKLLFDYLKEAGKPVIWTLHDVWPFTGHSAYCDAAGCEKWKNGCGNCPQIHIYPKSYIDRSRENWQKKRRIFCGVKHLQIVTPSEWLAGLARESFLGEYPVMVINNGIDTRKFQKIELQKCPIPGGDNKILLLSVATVWSDLKGLSDFIQLAGKLDDRYQIVLIGGMTKRQEKRLPERILHIPRTQNIEEMVKLYNAARAYINLTYCDTYPTVNLEAAACGTPVITYAVGGSTESAVKYGGKAVKRGDLDAVVETIDDMKEATMQIPNRNDLDREMTAEKYMSLYRNML